MAYHLLFVEGQTNKYSILLVLHPDITVDLFVPLIGFVFTAEFAITDFRVFNGFEQFSSQKIAGEEIPHTGSEAIV